MTWTVRLFGVDGDEITTQQDWLNHAPPEGGEEKWVDGYSAKELAKSWCPEGAPAVPAEIRAALDSLGIAEVDEFYGRPEHKTKLDDYGRARQHDLFGCARSGGKTQYVVGIEAKAAENFDGLVLDRLDAKPPSKKQDRCNLMARALFGKEVFRDGKVLDDDLASHGYQLWTAAVGTLREAQERDVIDAVLVVQQFIPRRLGAKDKRNWRKALSDKAAAFESFRCTVLEHGGETHKTPFVEPGLQLHVLKVETLFEPAAP